MSAPAVVARPPAVETNFRRFLGDFAENRVALVAAFVFATIVVLALAAPWVAPTDPYDLKSVSIMDNRLPPGSESMEGQLFLLGTDGMGRDMWSAILYGLRISLFVGATSAALAMLVGTTLGLLAAFFGGRFDSMIMRVADLQLSFPSILVALLLLAVLGRGVDKIILALVIVQWSYFARTVRGSALVERRREYVEAARCLAISKTSVLFRHILPNCLPPLTVVATIQVASAITLEATLSFLGVGLPPTEPSLGLLISNGFDYLLSGKYWISFYPGIALLITVMSINLMGDQVRVVLNPRLQR